MVEVLDQARRLWRGPDLLIGMAEGQLLSVIYTERQGRFRLITARPCNEDEQDHYFTQNSQGQA